MITAREILDKARASGHRLPYNEAAVLFAAAVRLAAANDSTLRGWLVLIDEAGGLHVGVFDEHAPEAEPAFLAPELMTADAPDKSDPKVQVYAAGVIGYELLTGKLAPIPGQPPGPELTGALGVVVRRALAADRRERIEDLRQLHEEVERVQPRPPAEGERNILSALRNRFSRPPPEKEAVAKLIDKLHHLEGQVSQLAKAQARLEAAHRQSSEAIERFEDGQRRAEEAGRRRRPVVAPALIAGLLASVAVLASAWALGMIPSPVLPLGSPAPGANAPAPPAATERHPEPKAPEPKPPERRAEEKPAATAPEPRSAQIDAGHVEADASAIAAADAGEADAGPAAVPDAGAAHAAVPAPTPAPKPSPPAAAKPAAAKPAAPAAAKPAPARNPEAAMLHAVATSQVRRGESALEEGRADEALESFRAALENEPANAAAFRGMGMAYAMQGNDTQALQAYEKYLRLAPKAADANEIRQSIAELKARAKQRANTQ